MHYFVPERRKSENLRDDPAARLDRWASTSRTDDSLAYAPARPAARPRETPALPCGRARDVAFVLFCVLLPLGSVLIEWGTRIGADAFFDPLPTPWHVAAALWVPLANAAVFWMTGSDRPVARRLLGWVNGIAIGVGLCYALLFLPLLPIALFAILAMGLGLLPMGPMFALIGALACRGRLNDWWGFADRLARPTERPRGVPGLWGGAAAGVVFLVGLHLPVVLTHHGLQMAASDDPAERREGIQLLRRWGSEDVMLQACYNAQGDWLAPSSFASFDGRGGNRTAGWRAQEAFYRVTGTPYEDWPAPGRATRRGERGFSEAEEQLRGGTTVGSTIPGLSLAGSRLDGSVDPAAATSYTEWTLTFKNDTDDQQEARARVLLPPGGVVSRLTLWIDGEEREAAFGRKAQVRAAYEKVVKVQRRDPVLVTSAGPDRVLVQCFPVPPGGTMKTRLGITAPLQLAAAADRGALRLPHFVDRNFAVGDGGVHSLWLEAPSALSLANVPGMAATAGESNGGKPGTWSLHGDLTDHQLAGRLAVDVPRPPGVTTVWAGNPFDKSVGHVVQTLERVTEPPAVRVVLAVDASASMAAAIPAVADALAALPPTARVSAVVAADEVVELPGPGAAALSQQLRRIEPRGGQDAVPTLARAWDLAAAEPGSVVVWVHGPQPVLLEPVDKLTQRLQRRPDGPRLLELQAVPGTNRVLEAVNEAVAVEAVPAAGSVDASLRDLFADRSTGRETVRLVRRTTTAEAPAGEGVRRGGVDLARLWANDEVLKLAYAPGPDATRRAADLAVAHRLVTPVSGAVVLETQRQYDDAGLAPVSAVPLPPGAWLMLFTLPVVWVAWRKWARAA